MTYYVVAWGRAYRLVNEAHEARVSALAPAYQAAVQAAQDAYADDPGAYPAFAQAVAAAEESRRAGITASELQRRQDIAAIESGRQRVDGNWADTDGPLALLASLGLSGDVIAVDQ